MVVRCYIVLRGEEWIRIRDEYLSGLYTVHTNGSFEFKPQLRNGKTLKTDKVPVFPSPCDTLEQPQTQAQRRAGTKGRPQGRLIVRGV